VTLRSRLFVAFVAVVGVPLLVGLVLLASALPRAFTDVQGRSVSAAARLAAAQLQAECDRARAVAEAGARAVLAVPADAVAAQRTALRSLVDRDLATGLRVTDGAGRITEAGVVPGEGADCAAGEYGSGPVVAVAELQQAGSAGTGRAMAAVGDVDTLLDDLRRLAGARGVLLVSGDDVLGAAGEVPDDVRAAALARQEQVVRRSGVVATAVPVPGAQQLRLVVTEPVTAGIDVVRTGLIVVLGAVLFAAAVAPLLARATTRPLEQLGDAAARVAAGDLDTTIDVRSRDEVGVLAGAFNVMTDELRDHVGQLQASRDELRAGLARLGETLTSTHDLDRILGVVLDTAVATTAAQAGAVLLVQPSGSELELAAARGLKQRTRDARPRVVLGEGVIGRVARDGRPLHGATAELGASPAEPTAETVVAVPMRGKDTVLGVLALYDTRGGASGAQDDLATLETLAGQAAVAVENVLLHRDVSRLAVTDGLTGLANYRSFTETIGREIDRASRFGRPVGLLLLDIDHFKDVNDTWGHQRGDAVLVELADRVRREVRDVDTVARYGGEELVVVLPETDQQGAEQAAERILAAVRDTPFGSGAVEPVRVTVSVGVAVHVPPGGTASALLRRADEALYAAKRGGRDTWRSASPVDAPH
jgi:diguanylate cyclase (GGDEF)-like protein